MVADNDQIRQKQLNKDGRPQSAQRNSRASCFTPQVKGQGRSNHVFNFAEAGNMFISSYVLFCFPRVDYLSSVKIAPTFPQGTPPSLVQRLAPPFM